MKGLLLLAYKAYKAKRQDIILNKFREDLKQLTNTKIATLFDIAS